MRKGLLMELGDSIKIGEFTIYEITACANYIPSFWIQTDGGEGMQIRTEELEKLLNQFWADEF